MAHELAEYFRSLADRKRLHIVELLADRGRMTVSQLGDELALSQPLISWHLRILRKAGIVETERRGRQVWCSLNRETLEKYQSEAAARFGLEAPDLPSAAGPRLEAVGER
ncbi:MAG TPA: metalloregulator ArsR/SmtB family transcription factor [Chloroflexota bacterium]|nr:metalloregulator ArsR/SmtB family transcription factor [Chloroflexota bacterium]